MQKLNLLVSLVVALCLHINALGAPEIEDFFERSQVYTPKLSPSGNHVAFLSPVKGKEYCLKIYETKTGETSEYRAEENQGIFRFYWLDDEWILFLVYPRLGRYNTRGYTTTGTYAININDPEKVAVLNVNSNASFVDRLPSDSNQFWMSVNYWKRAGGGQYKHFNELIKYDLTKSSPNKGTTATTFALLGAPVKTIKSPINKLASYWVTDLDSKPRITILFDQKSSEYTYNLYDDENELWKELSLDPLNWTILGFSDKNKILVNGWFDKEYVSLYEFDLGKNEFTQLIYKEDGVDVRVSPRYRYRNGNYELLGYRCEGKAVHNVWMDDNLKAYQGALESTFPGLNPRIVSFSNDLDKFIILTSNPQSPPEYYLCDVKKSKISLFSKSHPNLKKESLSQVFNFKFKTDDGLKLEAFLTKPKTPLSEKPPLVVLIHGGPHVRDDWDFNSTVQFLASRGYSVLQVNYRGSYGYGEQIYEDYGYRFDLMMDDIKKAIDLVVKQGIADPKKIALMGGSFGAYSSVYLAASYPEAFRCIVATAGIYDFEKELKELRKGTFRGKRFSGEYKILSERLGDLENNLDYVRKVSPINIAHQIKCPTLVVHGIDDSVVSFEQSKKLIQVLKSTNVELDYYFEYAEGHGFFEEENVVEYYEKVEGFLSKHLSSK